MQTSGQKTFSYHTCPLPLHVHEFDTASLCNFLQSIKFHAHILPLETPFAS